MSLAYRTILRMASQRITAVVPTGGTTAALFEAAYTTSPLTATQIGTTNFTISMVKDSLVSVIGRIIRAYASVPSHPFREYNLSQTASIAHKGVIPSVNSASLPIVGVYGAIRNASTGEEMTEQPVQIIKTIVDNTDTALKGTYDYYKIAGDRLYHTAANAVIDVCTFSASAEFTAIGANGDAPIPDACLDLAWTGLVASLFIDDEWVAQSNACSTYLNNGLADMAAGKTAFLPAPVLQSSQQPVIS